MNIAKSMRIANERGGTLTGSLMLTVLFSVGLIAAKDNFQQALQVKTENRYIGNTVPDVKIFFQPDPGNSDPASCLYTTPLGQKLRCVSAASNEMTW